jgi:hypothetical protein
MYKGREQWHRAGGQTREAASSVTEDREFAESNQSRRYQVTVWSNSSSGADAGPTGSKTWVWSNASQAGEPRVSAGA